MLDTESTVIEIGYNVCPVLNCNHHDDNCPDIYTNCIAITVCCSLFIGFLALVALLAIM